MTERLPVGKIAAHSAYDMFSWYKYLIVNLVFSHLRFWSGNLFLIASFPDLCLLVPSCKFNFVGKMNNTVKWLPVTSTFSGLSVQVSDRSFSCSSFLV